MIQDGRADDQWPHQGRGYSIHSANKTSDPQHLAVCWVPGCGDEMSHGDPTLRGQTAEQMFFMKWIKNPKGGSLRKTVSELDCEGHGGRKNFPSREKPHIQRTRGRNGT